MGGGEGGWRCGINFTLALKDLTVLPSSFDIEGAASYTFPSRSSHRNEKHALRTLHRSQIIP